LHFGQRILELSTLARSIFLRLTISTVSSHPNWIARGRSPRFNVRKRGILSSGNPEVNVN